jgi:hypothetical protein
MEKNTFFDDINYSNFNFRDLFPITRTKDIFISTSTPSIASNQLIRDRNSKKEFYNGLTRNEFITWYRKNKNNFGRNKFIRAYREKKKREQEILYNIQISKSKEAYNELQKELALLQTDLYNLKLKSEKEIPLPPQITQTLIAKIDENPNVEITKQLDSIPEISNEVVDNVVKEDKIVEDVKSNNGASNTPKKTTNWLLPTIVIIGIAYFVFKKK